MMARMISLRFTQTFHESAKRLSTGPPSQELRQFTKAS